MKFQLCYDLGNDEEDHHINAQKLAEVDLGGFRNRL
jgi:hypothetical protein